MTVVTVHVFFFRISNNNNQIRIIYYTSQWSWKEDRNGGAWLDEAVFGTLRLGRRLRRCAAAWVGVFHMQVLNRTGEACEPRTCCFGATWQSGADMLSENSWQAEKLERRTQLSWGGVVADRVGSQKSTGEKLLTSAQLGCRLCSLGAGCVCAERAPPFPGAANRRWRLESVMPLWSRPSFLHEWRLAHASVRRTSAICVIILTHVS